MAGDMTDDSLYEAIFRRKSVREYAPGNLSAETMSEIHSRISSLKPLFPGIRTELKVMTNPEVRGMFKVEAPHFLAFFSEVKEGYAANAGFMMQQMDLYFSSKGIGSCWQGGPKPIKESRSASELEFVTMLAFGPAAEAVHRNLSDFKREPMAKISNAKGFDELLEPARLAPSGMNNQPWYFTGGDGAVHVSSAKSLIVDRMNRISAGIALCHLWLAASHFGKTVQLRNDLSAQAKPPRNCSYVASLVLA